jgi:hypothetical protein
LLSIAYAAWLGLITGNEDAGMFAINQLSAFNRLRAVNQLKALRPGKRQLKLLPWLVSVVVSLPVQADKIYTWTDENGNRVYSDSPREGAETVKLKPIMRMDFPEPKSLKRYPNDRNSNA